MAIRTRSSARLIQGSHTEVVCQSYSDRVLVLVTQLGKVGCLVRPLLTSGSTTDPDRAPEEQIQGTFPSNAPLPPPILAPASPEHDLPSLPPPPPSLVLQPLLGSPPEDVYDAYAAQIATIVGFGMGTASSSEPEVEEEEEPVEVARRPVVVGLALNRSGGDERRRFGTVMSMVMDCRVW